MNCGLLGRTLKHSYSPQIHTYLGNYPYVLFEKEQEALSDFFQNEPFTGLNVTIPYKKDVIPFCKELTDCARKLGAVNTIVRQKDGTLIGHNTDYFGLYSTIERMRLNPNGKKALVLGSGGASVTAVAVLKEMGAHVVIISRSGENNYNNLHLHKDAAIIVNTTPVGMYPNTGISPIDLDLFEHLEGVLDIIYNPARTQLLLDAEKRGILTENGLWMLVAQAKESAEWFTGKKIPDDMIGYIHRKLRLQMENIILIGMPGCGKSTVGKLLAKELDKEFIDADSEIVKAAQMPIPELFEKYGEDVFRQWETKVLSEIGKRSGLVIATGGGCVTREENYPLLHQNGTLYWIQRDIGSLSLEGRPLSKAGRLEQMYEIRRPMYERFSDFSITNDDTPERTVAKIMHRMM